jgi:hypothetical protein
VGRYVAGVVAKTRRRRLETFAPRAVSRFTAYRTLAQRPSAPALGGLRPLRARANPS